MLKFFHNLLRRLRIAIAKPQIEKNRLEKSATFAWDLSRHCVHQLRKDKATQMAAALTYHTLFSLLPTLVLMLVVGRAFVGEAEIEQFKEWVVDNALRGLIVQEAPEGSPSQGMVSEEEDAAAARASSGTSGGGAEAEAEAEAEPGAGAGESAGSGPEQAGDEQAGLTRSQYHQARQQLKQDVQVWLDRLGNVSFGSIGVVGVLLFLFGAIGLLSTIEGSFNDIYGGSNNRPMRFRFPMYFTTLVLAPVVILAGQVVQQRALDYIGSVGWAGPLATVLVVLSPLATIWFVLWLMYTLLPNTRVSRRAAALGAFFAAVLWVLLITGFQIYTTRAATASLYGALALLPLALLWLWLTWLIVLFGLEVAYALQTLPERGLSEQERMSEQEQLFDARAVVPIMAAVGQAFSRGQPVTPSEVGAQLGLSDRLTSRVMDRLHEENLLHRVLDPSDSFPRFTLARPPGQITVRRLLDTGTRLTVSKLTAGSVPGASMMHRLNEAVANAAAETTLAHVIDAEAGENGEAVDGASGSSPAGPERAEASNA